MNANLEDIDIKDWKLIKETSDEKIYQKDDIEKKIQIFENYTLEENYKNGKLHGVVIGRMNQPFTHFLESKSKIYLIEYYENGRLSGLQRDYYEDGSRTETNWLNDQVHGKVVTYYSNGQKEKEKHYNKGILDGKQIDWYQNGQIKLEEIFAKGIPSGESLKYLESGYLKRKKYYQKGKIEGLVYELWDYNGKLIDGGIYSETEYKNDIQNGKDTVYFPNNTKMREGTYKNGIEEGERIWWNLNGSISIKEYFKNGELDGERIVYDEQGKQESIQKYANGQRIS